MPSRELTELEKQEMKVMYETTALAALSKHFSVPIPTVKKTLTDMGVALRGRGRIAGTGTNRLNEVHLVEEELPEEVSEALFDEDDDGTIQRDFFGD